MKKVLLISPHLDDAALSAGQFIAGRPECDILTIFTGTPHPQMLTTYDRDCGFTSAADAIALRKKEDEAAMVQLGANSIHLDFYDHQYKTKNDYPSMVEEIKVKIEAENYEFVLAPLGISHPDHETASNASLEAAKQLDTKIYLWEDLPSRVLWPEDVIKRMKALKNDGYILKKAFVGDGDRVQKMRALWCYQSQHKLLDINLCIVPERYYVVSHS